MKDKQRICVFLQARLDSVRLPNKAVITLAGKTVIEHAMDALKKVPAGVHALLTDAASAPVLSGLAEACGFELFTGPKEDVLLRFSQAAEFFGADVIVRATGDNPLVSRELAELLLDQSRERGADYGGFLGMPLGLGVEYLSRYALDAAAAEAADPYEREHVAPFIIRRPARFHVHEPPAPDEFRHEARVTLDTREDYGFLSRIFSSLYRGETIGTAELITWLKQNTPAPNPDRLCVP
ncbi:MAG: acylneuraminate cytidylyltransferase [Spirochaetales bacterium]|nr:MAG: acylneuraminate cytidylyltransferase [Spirochaetales bacterium]